MSLNRRGFITGMTGVLAAGAAPAFVKTGLMPIFVPKQDIIIPTGFKHCEGSLARYAFVDFDKHLEEVADFFHEQMQRDMRRAGQIRTLLLSRMTVG